MKTELTSANDIIWELMHGKHKVNITEVDRAVRALDKARQSAEYSSLYWILRKIVNGQGEKDRFFDNTLTTFLLSNDLK